jgi:hypothetical protein
VAGERRLIAARLNGFDTVPVVIRPDLDTAEKILMAAFSENEMREPLTAYERVRFGMRIEPFVREHRQQILERLGASAEYRTAEIVGDWVGIGTSSYLEGKTVIERAAADPDLTHLVVGLQSGTLHIHTARRELESYDRALLDAPLPEERPLAPYAPDARAEFVASMARTAGALYDALVDDDLPLKPLLLTACVNGRQRIVRIEIDES